jgi:hypothetical protein
MSCSIIEQRIHDLETLLDKFSNIDLEQINYKVTKGNQSLFKISEKNKSNYFIEIELNEQIGRPFATQLAYQYQSDIEKWAAKEYGEAYTYGWAKIDNSHWKKLVIELSVPKSIDDGRVLLNKDIDAAYVELDDFNTKNYAKELQEDLKTTAELEVSSELTYAEIASQYEETITPLKSTPKQLSLDFEFDESKVTSNAAIHPMNIKNIVIKHKKC